jgi:hypothetical protein
VLLVGGNKESRRESIVAVFRSVANDFGETFFIAVIDATVFEVVNNIFAILVEAVFFFDD